MVAHLGSGQNETLRFYSTTPKQDFPKSERTFYVLREAVIREILRIEALVPSRVPHKTLVDTELMGYKTPKFKLEQQRLLYDSTRGRLGSRGGEELTRYLFFLQLKHDLLERRLDCPDDKATELCALALQCKYMIT
uniref:FERM domain-containing protein n=1 Tax=Glossina austeni TaxID=7395 RepID=A0A1A9UCN0_GLOAU